MLVLNETVPEFQLGNNLLNIDEKVSLALYEINEEYNWIIERTNVVLEYGVIHEGVIISIIKALINFFKKVIETLLSIFTGGSSGGGGGGSGGGGSSGGGSGSGGSYDPFNLGKPITINTYEFPDYYNWRCATILSIVELKYIRINTAFSEFKDSKDYEKSIKKAFMLLFPKIKLEQLTAENIQDNIKEMQESFVEDILQATSLNFMGDDLDESLTASQVQQLVYETIVGEKRERTIYKIEAENRNKDINNDKKEIKEAEKLIKKFQKDFDNTIKELDNIEKDLSNQPQTKDINLAIVAVRTISKCAMYICSNCLIPVCNAIIKATELHIKESEMICKKFGIKPK